MLKMDFTIIRTGQLWLKSFNNFIGNAKILNFTIHAFKKKFIKKSWLLNTFKLAEKIWQQLDLQLSGTLNLLIHF